MRRSLAFVSAALGIPLSLYTNGDTAPPAATPPAATQPAATQPNAAPTGGVTLSTVEVRGRSEDLLGIADTSNQGYVGHDEIERAVLIAMHLGELGVVVRCSANSYASNQSKTAPLGHAYSLAFGFGDESAKIEVTAKES